jgi:hypothetical protein
MHGLRRRFSVKQIGRAFVPFSTALLFSPNDAISHSLAPKTKAPPSLLPPSLLPPTTRAPPPKLPNSH